MIFILNHGKETSLPISKYLVVVLIALICFSAPVLAEDIVTETVQNQEEVDDMDEGNLGVFWTLIFVLLGLTSLFIVGFLFYRYYQFRENNPGKEEVLRQEIKNLTEQVNVQRAKGQVITDDLLEELNRAEMNIDEGNYELAEGHIAYVREDLGIKEESEED